MKKVIAFTLAVIVLAVSFIPLKVYATDDPSPTPTPDPVTMLSIQQGGSTDINTMMYYYRNVLNSDQQKIVRFLIGSYNNMYLNSRGFSYRDVSDLNDYIDKFDEFGALVVGLPDNYVETENSRWNTNFQLYIASIITYAGNVNKTFSYWIENMMPYVSIPYTSDALDAWTDFYNDPSNIGIVSYGQSQREWVSGNSYQYLLGDYPFQNQAASNLYTNFILNNYPISYSNKKWYPQSILVAHWYQYVVAFNYNNPFDTLYILRSQSNQYRYFRYGYELGVTGNISLNGLRFQKNDSDSYVMVQEADFKMIGGTQDAGSVLGLDDIIAYAFNFSPIGNFYAQHIPEFEGAYPYIQHVYLVDDLDSLTNKQEVFNDYTLGIINGNDWIRKPNPNRQIVWLLDEQVPKVIDNGSLIDPTDNDFSNQIINNTVINNYDIVAPGVTINVPVDWFQGEGNYLGYTNTTALPFFVFVGDVFNSLGEIRIFIIAVIILGLAGGVLTKFLL